ncbi:MAG: hypothetical protein H0X16_06780 [Chloroflexi bacterium]|nr:hypothetical protein [Chloroflexota bacterium]
MTAEAKRLADLVPDLSAEREHLERELNEIGLLVQQAETEAGRHEQKRKQAADRFSALGGPDALPQELRESVTQLVTLTRRAAVMESQVEILRGKQKTLDRYRDGLTRLAEQVPAAAESGGLPAGGGADPSAAVVRAQEDLRRQIARQMHDGPAQSLTNIVLQAEIVRRLVGKNDGRALAEAHELVEMVQHTLDATKSFIFDVRPMVLDDLGLVPTVRRAAWDRGRQAGVTVTFESIGADRRLDVEAETALFRIIDDAIAGYLSQQPDGVRIRLDWLDSEVQGLVGAAWGATPEPQPASGGKARASVDDFPRSAGERPTEVSPVLAAMMEQQRDDEDAASAVAASAAAAARSLPPATWSEIQSRARVARIEVTLSADGGTLTSRTPYPMAATSGDQAEQAATSR